MPSDAGTVMQYAAQAWSCRDFDEQECAEQLQDNVREHHNTIFSCKFVPAAASAASAAGSASTRDGLLIATYQSGDVRLFRWNRVCSSWLSSRIPSSHAFGWPAHSGAVYAAAIVQSERGALLATAGDDGCLRLWKLADVLAAAAAAELAAAAAAAEAAGDGAADSTQQQQELPPAAPLAAACLQLSHVHNSLGVSAGAQPAAQALAVDEQQQRLFVGGSDGGVHIISIPALLAAAAQGAGAAAAAAAAATTLSGHLAGVLDLDFCAARQQLASASEDGTIRVWDLSTQACVAIINPAEGASVSLHKPLDLLKCVRSPAVTAVRFGSGGNWLLAGCGGGLTLWNCSLAQVAKTHALDGCIPQVLLLGPNSVLVAGTDGKVHAFSFSLEPRGSFDVGAASVFGLDADVPGSEMLAVCGSKGCLDLLANGQCKGVVRPPPSVLLQDGV